jgi:hypothetical protein
MGHPSGVLIVKPCKIAVKSALRACYASALRADSGPRDLTGIQPAPIARMATTKTWLCCKVASGLTKPRGTKHYGQLIDCLSGLGRSVIARAIIVFFEALFC